MTPATLASILQDLQPLGLSVRRLAELFGYASENSVRQWLGGAGHVPPDVAAWLEALHAWSEANPPPRRR